MQKKPATPKIGSAYPVDYYTPSIWRLRSVKFNEELATFYCSLGLSAEGVIDWILTQLFDEREGRLFDFDGTQIPIDTDASITDEIWGDDARRTINRFLKRADQPFRYRLQMRMVGLIMLMALAREIHQRRMSDQASVS